MDVSLFFFHLYPFEISLEFTRPSQLTLELVNSVVEGWGRRERGERGEREKERDKKREGREKE